MEKWFEIFRAGDHTSSNGKARIWTKQDLDYMVSSYNENDNPAPLVIGHPKSNGPAYGWVDKLARVGDNLLALPKQVSPALSELVKNGTYPKRSISVKADGTLNHVGFIGAFPPAVKGLEDIEFAGGDSSVIYDFSHTGEAMSTYAEDFAEDERIAEEMAAPHQHRECTKLYFDDLDVNMEEFTEDERIAEEMAAGVHY